MISYERLSLIWGPTGLFGTRDRRDIGKLGFKITGNVIRYTHGTGNVLIFLLGKQEKYDSVISGQIILARSNKAHI